jgi:hypothetical protein
VQGAAKDGLGDRLLALFYDLFIPAIGSVVKISAPAGINRGGVPAGRCNNGRDIFRHIDYMKFISAIGSAVGIEGTSNGICIDRGGVLSH